MMPGGVESYPTRKSRSKTRALPLQPYFESGFPYGHDQWISAAGTSWASMALALTVEPQKLSKR